MYVGECDRKHDGQEITEGQRDKPQSNRCAHPIILDL